VEEKGRSTAALGTKKGGRTNRISTKKKTKKTRGSGNDRQPGETTDVGATQTCGRLFCGKKRNSKKHRCEKAAEKPRKKIQQGRTDGEMIKRV